MALKGNIEKRAFHAASCRVIAIIIYKQLYHLNKQYVYEQELKKHDISRVFLLRGSLHYMYLNGMNILPARKNFTTSTYLHVHVLCT